MTPGAWRINYPKYGQTSYHTHAPFEEQIRVAPCPALILWVMVKPIKTEVSQARLGTSPLLRGHMPQRRPLGCHTGRTWARDETLDLP